MNNGIRPIPFPPRRQLITELGRKTMQRLLADRKQQLGDEFDLRDFHDQLMKLGRLPLSLIRWEMTGLEDEISGVWDRDAMP